MHASADHISTRDFSFVLLNEQSHAIIGFDRLLYCLCLGNRSMIKITQLGIIGLIGIGIDYQIWWSSISLAAACSLVSLGTLVLVARSFRR
jgi:hypothetical protein